MSITIPRDVQIYVTKTTPGVALSVRLDTTLVDDTLHTLYDVKMGTDVVIPRGTRVMGNWVTESEPVPAIQLQLTKICFDGGWIPIKADSNVFETVTFYNRHEIHNPKSVRRLLTYKSTANIYRRIVNVRCHVTTLPDNFDPNFEIPYMNIHTDEIPVTLLENLVI